MATGYCSAFAEQVDTDFVIKTVGKSVYNKFWKYLTTCEKKNMPHHEGYFEDSSTFGDVQIHHVNKMFDEYKKVREAFREKTRLNISLCYHDQADCGDRYDDVDGWYWAVDYTDLYVPTKKYKDFKKQFGDNVISRQFYVING